MLGELKRRVSRKKDYKNVFSSKQGEAVLADLYKFCGLGADSYVQGSFDRTAYNEGMKRVGLYIQRIINQSDEDINRILEAQQSNQYKDILNDRSITR